MANAKTKRPNVLPPAQQGTKDFRSPEEDNATVRWCFKGLRKGYKLTDISDPRDCKSLLHAFEVRSDLTWKELLHNNPYTRGITNWDPKKITNDSIPNEYTNDKHVLKFYAGGKKGGRVLGFRRDRTFEIKWIDFKFDLYKHD